MEHGKGMVIFVTANNPQTLLFVEYICRKLHSPVHIVEPLENHIVEDFSKDRGQDTCMVVMLDSDHLNDTAMQKWQAQCHKQALCKLAAFNFKDESHAANSLLSMPLQGVFYRDDSLEIICKGIEHLLNGDLWLSRGVMAQLIEFYRSQQITCYRPISNITQRELEIISLLGSGATNTEIAKQLFVSEHTIKSHLYNIFRKLNVHNRIQAVNWARQNLGSSQSVALGDSGRAASGQ